MCCWENKKARACWPGLDCFCKSLGKETPATTKLSIIASHYYGYFCVEKPPLLQSFKFFGCFSLLESPSNKPDKNNENSKDCCNRRRNESIFSWRKRHGSSPERYWFLRREPLVDWWYNASNRTLLSICAHGDGEEVIFDL